MRVLLATALLVSVLEFAGGAGAQSGTLFATVGPGFSIGLADASGNPVTALDPGTYTIQVEDKAAVHNFHLTGPGVDQSTTVEQTGTFTWTVTLTAGTYHYQCDPHASVMKGDFTVGSASPQVTQPPPTPAPPKPRARLAASVGPGAAIVVTRRGARLKSIPAGPVRLVVTDRSARDNFHLVGPGVNRASSRRGRGTSFWNLTLKRGLYTYRSDASPALRGSFRAT